jgi:quinol monooxygenase YgiN
MDPAESAEDVDAEEECHLHVTVTSALSGNLIFAGEFASKQAFAEHVETHFPERFQEVWFLQDDRPLSRSLDTLHLPPPDLPLSSMVPVTLAMVKGPQKDLFLEIVANNGAETLLLVGQALPHLHMSDIVQAIGRVLVSVDRTTVVAQRAMTDEELTEQWQRTAPGQEPQEAQVMALWYVAADNKMRGPLTTSLKGIWEDALAVGHVRLCAYLEAVKPDVADPVPLRPPLLRCRNGRFDDFFRYA